MIVKYRKAFIVFSNERFSALIPNPFKYHNISYNKIIGEFRLSL